METRLQLQILAQPNDTTCGPTCLQAVYGYYGDAMPLDQVIAEVSQLETGGTLAVLLGIHALRRGYRATIYTYNLTVFDPTWFERRGPDLRERLRVQREIKTDPRLRLATDAYLEFLERGGRLRFEDLTRQLIRRHLRRAVPILTGLSATFLYRQPREHGPRCDPDDVRGEPVGHFVVLCGYDPEQREVLVADPLSTNPYSPTRTYQVPLDRLVCSILLGSLTYDANLLLIEPARRAGGATHVDPRGRQ